MQRSAGSSPVHDLPHEPVFFLDEDTSSRQVAEALREAGAAVRLHRELFTPGTDDRVWIREVAAKGWAILSRDRRISRNELERQAVMQARARKFTLRSKKNLTGTEMAAAFVKALPQMRTIIAAQPSPLFARVYRDGTVRLQSGPGGR